MQIQTKDFQEVVENLLPGISKKDLVAQMSRIIFRDDIAGTWNDQIAISYPLELGGINCSVPAEDLSKILSGITEDEVDIKVTEGQMIITSASTHAQVSTISESTVVEDFYASLDLQNMVWNKLPDDFLEKLNLVRFSVSSNTYDSDNIFCIAIIGNYLYSGDGYRCTRVMCPIGAEKPILIPQSSVSSIIKFSDIVEYAISDGWINFATTEDVIISSRIVNGSFPDVDHILDNFVPYEQIVLSNDIIPVLDNIDKLLSEDQDFLKSVNISLTKGKTFITGKKEGLNIKKVVSNTPSNTNDVSFDISPAFLSNLLTLNIIEKFQISQSNSAKFTGEGFSHLIVLPIK